MDGHALTQRLVRFDNRGGNVKGQVINLPLLGFYVIALKFITPAGVFFRLASRVAYVLFS